MHFKTANNQIRRYKIHTFEKLPYIMNYNMYFKWGILYKNTRNPTQNEIFLRLLLNSGSS